MKHNKPTTVILRKSEYQHLIQATSRKHNDDTAHWIMHYKPAGSRLKENIDRFPLLPFLRANPVSQSTSKVCTVNFFP